MAALLRLSCWWLVVVVWLFLAVPRVCLKLVIVAFPGHTHLLVLGCGPREGKCVWKDYFWGG